MIVDVMLLAAVLGPATVALVFAPVLTRPTVWPPRPASRHRAGTR